MRHLATYLIGVIFGAGITVSGMVNPAKVLNFFDFAGTWDPSMLLVMGSAVTVTFFGYRAVFRRPTPIFQPGFAVPTNRKLDARLIGGSALFGIGWGVAGFCPGAAIPALGTGAASVFIFTAAMIGGILIAKWALNRAPAAAAA